MNEPINVALYRYYIQRFAKAEQPQTIVEVGVYCADLSRLLLPIKSVKRLILVDSWANEWKTQEHMDCIARSVMAWAETDARVQVVREASVQAAKRFSDHSIDFWHLDADHSYESVVGDLAAWRHKVKPGKLMTGDNFEIPAVAKAVREMFGSQVSTQGEGRIWIVRV
jgi:predicted O-methyltransferase YrrM